MSPAATHARGKAPKAAGRLTSPLVVQKIYAPDLRRQVEALLVVLRRAQPNGDGRAQP